MLTGGCFCGAVRYEVTSEIFHSTLCHCSDCRRIAGAPAVAWFSVARAGFRITEGVPRTFSSSAKVERQFCGDCGTGLTYARTDLPTEIDVTSCSLDAAEEMPPADNTWTVRRLDWMNCADGLPEYASGRE